LGEGSGGEAEAHARDQRLSRARSGLAVSVEAGWTRAASLPGAAGAGAARPSVDAAPARPATAAPARRRAPAARSPARPRSAAELDKGSTGGQRFLRGGAPGRPGSARGAGRAPPAARQSYTWEGLIAEASASDGGEGSAEEGGGGRASSSSSAWKQMTPPLDGLGLLSPLSGADAAAAEGAEEEEEEGVSARSWSPTALGATGNSDAKLVDDDTDDAESVRARPPMERCGPRAAGG